MDITSISSLIPGLRDEKNDKCKKSLSTKDVEGVKHA